MANWFTVDPEVCHRLVFTGLALPIAGGLVAGGILGTFVELEAMKLSPYDEGQGILGFMFGLPLLFLLIVAPLAVALYSVLRRMAARGAFGYATVVLAWIAVVVAGWLLVFLVGSMMTGGLSGKVFRDLCLFVHLSIIFGTLSGSVFWWIVGCLESDVFQSLAASPARGALMSVIACAAIIVGEEWMYQWLLAPLFSGAI